MDLKVVPTSESQRTSSFSPEEIKKKKKKTQSANISCCKTNFREMAYAAAVSLKDVLRQLHSFSDELSYVHFRVSSDRGSSHLQYGLSLKLGNTHYSASYIQILYQLADSLQRFGFEENGMEGKYFEKEIRDALWRAEDIIESYIFSHLLSLEDANESLGDMSHEYNFSKELYGVIQEIESIKERNDKFPDDLKHGQESSIIASIDDLPPVHKNEMVGLDGELEEMKNLVLGSDDCGLGAIVIHGIGGIGKTSLAISIYNDLDVRNHFCVGAWVKISLEHSARNILLNIWHTMEFFHDKRMMNKILNSIIVDEMDDEELENFLREKFTVQRYLVIVDCLCDINLSSWDYIKALLPDSNHGSRILLFSRVQLNSNDELVRNHYQKGFLDAPHSWKLLQQQVLGNESVPKSALEKIGRKIAKNCQGLPLAIITVGVHLAKEEKSVEYWNKVEESGNSIAYAADGATMFEQLSLSYKQMPRHLRPIFLFMGAFPERHEIVFSELYQYWLAERLLDMQEFGNVENLCWETLKYFTERKFFIRLRSSNTEMYKWSLHHALWHFCCTQAKKEAFFHVFDEYIGDEEDSNINSKIRRLIVRKTVLFGITDFLVKINHSLFSIRSLLLTGPYHPYPLIGISWGSYKRLRVLNACSIHFSEFPPEILYLNLLHYLALTLNGGDIPSGIAQLSILETLIVHFHHIVRSCIGGPLYLPVEIWKMQKLAHLQVIGFDLPVPSQSDALLPHLGTLLDVSPYSCTKKVLERIPNLTRLKISINFAPNRSSVPICLFDHNVLLNHLHTTSFVITNPYFEENTGPQVVAMPEIFSYSMKNLYILRFSGCGFSWDSIEPISQLPFLGVLELKSHAFRGPKWELTSTGFSKLEHLHLEDLDLVSWTKKSEDDFFPGLRRVSILKCHKLEQIPQGFLQCHYLSTIEVLDSSHAAEKWARSIQMELPQTSTVRIIVASQRGKSNSKFISMYEFLGE